MPTRVQALYASGDLIETGDSGWLDVQDLLGDPLDEHAFTRIYLALVPGHFSSTETMDLTLSHAWDASGGGSLLLHTFTQITSTEVTERLILPGGESGANLVVATVNQPTLILPYWKLAWTIAGDDGAVEPATPVTSVNFTLYAALEW